LTRRFLGSTTNPVRGGEKSVFSFQFSEISARPIRIRAIRLIRGSPSSHF
jgi:hypothetical protein